MQSEIFVQWYRSNYMKVNVDKFQAIIFGADNNTDVTFVIDDNDIKAESEVKLLGIFLTRSCILILMLVIYA